MLFNSREFLLFLPIVFLLYWLVFARSVKWQNWMVVVASYVFYGWWDLRFLGLILFTTLCTYLTGMQIVRCQSRGGTARGIMWGNIWVNLGLLALFKYYNFFAESLQQALGTLHLEADLPTLRLVLPVGISFYTFQAISYTIDVYRKKIGAVSDASAFFAYICFFPQLVAGPIERATDLLPQFQRPRSFSYEEAVSGCRLMLWGFFKKVVVADSCAYYANLAFNESSSLGSLSHLLGALFFTFQIYGDFSGYSSIAIGCARLLGIHLQPNFRVPYFSRDVAEFWKRWHISLNRWFVDYVYVPLGGSRVAPWRCARNVFVVFLLSGLWHGANWTYVAWGFYHALLFLPLLLFKGNHRYAGTVAEGHALPSLSELFRMVATFMLVVIGWVFFRAESLSQAFLYLGRILRGGAESGPYISLSDAVLLSVAILVMVWVEWYNRLSDDAFGRLPRHRWLRWSFYCLLLLSIYLYFLRFVECDSPFIYFQF